MIYHHEDAYYSGHKFLGQILVVNDIGVIDISNILEIVVSQSICHIAT